MEGGREEARPLVLLVDDDPLILRSYGRPLDATCDVLRARGYDEAFEVLADRRPDCAILDIDLGPGPNGIELRDALRLSWRDVPVLFITGHALFQNPTVQIAPDEIERKPVEASTLLAFVRGHRPHRKSVDVLGDIAAKISRRPRMPTPTETAVVMLRALGVPRPLLSDAMSRSESGLRQLEAAALEKLDLESPREARDTLGKPTLTRLAATLEGSLAPRLDLPLPAPTPTSPRRPRKARKSSRAKPRRR